MKVAKVLSRKDCYRVVAVCNPPSSTERTRGVSSTRGEICDKRARLYYGGCSIPGRPQLLVGQVERADGKPNGLEQKKRWPGGVVACRSARCAPQWALAVKLRARAPHDQGVRNGEGGVTHTG